MGRRESDDHLRIGDTFDVLLGIDGHGDQSLGNGSIGQPLGQAEIPPL